MIDVRPHVVPQQPLQGELLPTVVAGEAQVGQTGHALPLAVVQELHTVSEQRPALRAAYQSLL